MSADEVMPHSYSGSDDAYATRRLHVAQAVSQPVDVPVLPPATTKRRTRTGPPSFGSHLLNLLVVSIVVLLVAIPSVLYYLDRAYTGKIYPNVRIAGVSVGEMSPADAETAVRAKYAAFLNQPLTLSYNDERWQPSAQDLGLSFNVKAAVNDAFRSGRGQGLLDDLQSIAAIWQNGLDIPVEGTADARALQAYVNTISAKLEVAPVDATLSLQGTEISTTPMVIGRQVQIDETVRAASDALLSLAPQTVAVRTRELPPRLNDTAVADARSRLAALLDSPLTLKAEKRSYSWSPDELALMLDIARTPQSTNADQITIGLNKLQVNRRLEKMVDEIGRGSVNPRVSWNGGDLKIIKPGQTGLRLDTDGARQAIFNWNGDSDTIELPVNIVQPQVTEANLNSLGITELISSGRSDFSGSADYRIHNIGVGMQKFQGILLAPDEEFSFNENVGSIDAPNGFVEGSAIVNNRVTQEFGGGICQDSTTMFRAAFWAGLPITERWGHSFYISWYDKYALGTVGNGPGMDATIFTGGPDLKFVNDTGHWLLIQTSSNPASGVAEVAMYGTKPNRTVELTQKVTDRKPEIKKPVFYADAKQARGTYKLTDTKRGGMTIEVYRTIIQDGKARKPQLFETVFKPWADKYALNPADLSKKGQPLIGGPWSGRPQVAPAAPAAPAAPVSPVPTDPNAPVPAPQG